MVSPLARSASGEADIAKMSQPTVPRLLVIAGPAGSGKSTLINRLMDTLGKDKIGFCVSHTTRPAHPDEQEGVNYHFFTDEDFEKAYQNNEFVEHTDFCGHRYGTSKRAVLSVLETGKLCILQLDHHGMKSLKKLDLNPICIWIEAPTLRELMQRIRDRGADSEEELEERLAVAREESAFGNMPGVFDYVVVNDDLDHAYEELKKIIEKVHGDTAG